MKYSGLAQEFHQLLRNVERISAGQAAVEDWGSAPLQFGVDIVPKDGLYRRGRFTFKFSLHDQYPQYPPRVVCLTNIYHPNIDTVDEYEGEICLSMLDEWQPTFTLEDVIIGLLFLLYHPNLEEPLSPFFEPCMNWEEFAEKVRLSLQGGVVEDYYFQRNQVEEGDVHDGTGPRATNQEPVAMVKPRVTNQEPVAMVKPRVTNQEPVAMMKPRVTNQEPVAMVKGREQCGHLDVLR
ncbi:NEDD8-conjugating enzyme ubc12-like [Branchiostoma floridae]|uniref:NEDD8-conjugating enzyme ubc12-like n=1 Tax=Branchiostoma floridae TaxID=7739 RepID=A0A9J7LMW4_BRAFL|nr:NEDD8-conjugating enzyme ubc12-like [Branchiostoma floridae]